MRPIIYLIQLLIINQIEFIKTDDLREANSEVTTYNDFFSYLFGVPNDLKRSEKPDHKNTTDDMNAENRTDIDFVCNPRNMTSNQINQVQLFTLQSKSYIPLISESSIEMINKNNECILLLLFFDWCPHSLKIAPFYNAVGRAYPQLHVYAMNSYNHNGINFRLSLSGVPSIVLIQSDRVVARFNETDINLTTLKEFITKMTSFEPIHELVVNEDDLNGPVPTKMEPQFDYIMFLCVIFLIFSFIYFSFNRIKRTYVYLIETIRSTWLESQIDRHEHMD